MVAFAFAPLLADIGDLIAAAAAILVPLAYVVRAIIAARGSGKNEPNAPQRPAPRRVAPQQQGQAGNQPKHLVDEVEEFLRRAAERRRGGPPREVEIVRVEEAPPQRSTRPSQGRVERPMLTDLETDEERIGRESVARHVEQHLDTASYAERASHLAKVDNADELMEAHLSSVFDHQVGNIAQPSAPQPVAATPGHPASEVPAVAAATIADLFASPENLRNAFVLQEILRRPDDHW